MTETQIDNRRLATALVALSHDVLHAFNDAGRGHELTAQQTELICAVIVRERVRMSDLGKLLHLEKSALSGLVDRAEQRGLIRRVRDPKDRRVTWVELTEEGHSLAVQTHCEVTSRINAMVERLEVGDQARLASVVEGLLS
ncbi:MAG: MarR family transcriptional regulator [Nonomuraea sp.]|nr:MarR family transcriptional regulator [Nonomuraea sp.]